MAGGVDAFRDYDWYYRYMKRHMKAVDHVFLVPCAAHKPIHQSPLHRSVYRKYAARYGRNRELLVVSEPVVLIRYEDLTWTKWAFMYDFPPKLLGPQARAMFVRRLGTLLQGKSVIGCLPRHHARLVDDAIGPGWANYWSGDLFRMMHKAAAL